MSNDSETVEDTEKGSLAEVTDDSCTAEFTEIVPLDRVSDVYHKFQFIEPVIEVKPEELLEIKKEPADENDNEDPVDLLDMKHKLQFTEPVVEVKPSDLLDMKCKPQFIERIVEVKPEDFLDVKQEPAGDSYETESSCFNTQVSSISTLLDLFFVVVCLWSICAQQTL